MEPFAFGLVIGPNEGAFRGSCAQAYRRACVAWLGVIGGNVGMPMERGIMNLMNADPPEAARVEQDDEMVLDPRVQESIGRSLKAHYDDLINAPVPDRFLALLAQLEDTERRLKAEGGSDERS